MDGLVVVEEGLVPVYQDQSERMVVNARELYDFLSVGKDFSTWIKGRLSQYGFIKGEDFTWINSGVDSSPKLGNGNYKGLRTRIDYLLTVDVAKEIAMAENNDQGRQVRRYFIECERRLRQTTVAPTPIDEQFFTNPDTALRLVQNWRDEYNQRVALQAQVAVLEQDKTALKKEVNIHKLAEMKNKSKVEFATVMHTLDDTTSVGSFAKLLNPNGKILGQNRLFKWFRQNKYVMYSGKFNVPTQRSIANGWLKLVEDHKELSNGERMLIQTTRVTMKGQAYFTKKLLEEFKELRPNV